MHINFRKLGTDRSGGCDVDFSFRSNADLSCNTRNRKGLAATLIEIIGGAVFNDDFQGLLGFGRSDCVNISIALGRWGPIVMASAVNSSC